MLMKRLQLHVTDMPLRALRHLLMKIKKDGMPGISIFMDTGITRMSKEIVASYSKWWEVEGQFQATNAASYMWHIGGEQGLSFFPATPCPNVGESSRLEQRAGEEHLDAALQPYQKDLAMEIMFDLSGMETGPTMDDALGNEDEWPSKDALMDESNAVNTAQEQNDDGFLGISKAQLGFYDKKGVLKTPKISELQ